jgi:hypothetical protein
MPCSVPPRRHLKVVSLVGARRDLTPHEPQQVEAAWVGKVNSSSRTTALRRRTCGVPQDRYSCAHGLGQAQEPCHVRQQQLSGALRGKA